MKPFYADEIKYLTYPDAEILLDDGDCLLYIGKADGSALCRAANVLGAEKIKAALPKDVTLVCARGPVAFGKPDACYHAEYHGAPIHLPESEFTFKTLNKDYVPWLAKNYHSDEEYLTRLVELKYMTGAFTGGVPAGFIGRHERGSMGLLFVEESFRRKGLGYQLEAYKINEVLRSDETPFCHIRLYNAPSLNLQKKLGLEISAELVSWYDLEKL